MPLLQRGRARGVAGGVKRLWAAHTGTGAQASNIASVLVPLDGHIVGVHWSMRLIAAVAARVQAEFELSYSSVGTSLANDMPQAISTYSQSLEFVTSGMSPAFVPIFVPIPGLMTMQGTNLYLHGLVTSTVVVQVYCSVYLDFPTMLVPSPVR